jgi:hypothetical protein
MYAHIRINGSDVMMCDLFPEYGMSIDKPCGVTNPSRGRRFRPLIQARHRCRRNRNDAAAGHVLGQPLWPVARSVRPQLGGRIAAEEVVWQASAGIEPAVEFVGEPARFFQSSRREMSGCKC